MTSLVNGAGWYLLHPLWIEENYDAQARSMTCETRRLPPQADATKEMACGWIRQVDHLFGAGICHHSAVPPVQSHRSMACETRRLPPQADATKEMACGWIRQVDHLFGAGICHHSAVPPVQSHRSMACETRRLPPQRAARTRSVIMLPPCCLVGNVRTDRPSVVNAVDNVG